MIRITPILAACALLGACATASQPQTASMIAGKSLATAWAALDAAAKASDAAVASGYLKGAAAGTVANDLTKANLALGAAQTAYNGSQNADITAQLAAATTATAEILQLAGVK
jgi:hypothetical protein